MKTAQILKLVLAVAILFAVFRLVSDRRAAQWGVQPYSFESYEDDSAGEDYEDADEAEEGDAGEEDEDEDEDEEEADEDEEDDEDEDGEDGEDGEDDDYENDMEGFSNAQPSSNWGSTSGVPLMNIATDLLPKAVSKAQQQFAEFAPKSLLGQNFLDAKKYIGVDTQGSSLRNANYDLRSSPAIPRRDVGPWAQSTIEGDLYRKPLE